VGAIVKRNLFQMLGLLSLVCLLAALPACGNARTGKPKVAIVTNATDPFWDICQAGAMKAAADFDIELVFKQPTEMTVDAQMKIVEDLTKLGIKGLAVSVIKPLEQTPKLKALAQDLPEKNFLTLDNDAPETGRLCYVGCDNFEAGKEVGRLVKRALPNGGTVALFIGSTDSDNGVNRVAGVLSELADRDVRAEVKKGQYEAKYGNYTLHSKQPILDGADKDRATTNAADNIEQLKTTQNVAFVGLYSYNPAKILEAAKAKGVVGKIKIIGFDEDISTLDGIDKGQIEASISQDPFNYGYETVKWLRHVIDGKDRKALPQKPTPYSIITRDGKTPELPGIKNRMASEYTKIINEATKKK
jgi:ribose transport system substrate-binding protein